VISWSSLNSALTLIAAFSAGRAQIGACIVGGAGAGNANCWLTSCEVEQLNALTARRRMA
jgi:hypothetical protein